MTDYLKFLWVELIAFDNRQPDMGAGAYLDSLGFVPDSISIFMWGSDFVHLHDGVDGSEFPPDIGAYMDVYFNGPKKAGVPWRKNQLRDLIRELQQYGVKVLFSIFPVSLNNQFHDEWVSRHPEVAYECVPSMQPSRPVINPLKRLADHTLYEDFLLGKVMEVIRDYNFDGWHLADGYNHSWYQLCHADFSADMIAQFTEHTGIGLPEHADIWRDYRREWIGFHRWRWENYLRKITSTLHADGRIVTSNTCWTRDPVEAIYRYGIDYRKYPGIGIDYLIIETCSAMGELLDCACQAHFPVQFFNVIKTTSLLTSACAPSGTFLFNSCTQDITEGWSSLRHAPGFLEREILAYSNFYQLNDGKLKKCFGGLQICLAADIEPHEWHWMKKRWELGFGTAPRSIDGVAVLWSDSMVEAELEYYLKTRHSLTTNTLYNLFEHGLQSDTVVRLDELPQCAMPVLVINSHLLPPDEQSAIHGYSANTLFLIDVYEDRVQMRVRSAGGSVTHGPEAELPLRELPADLMSIPEPKTFFHEQYYLPLPEQFYRDAVKTVSDHLPETVHVIADFNLPDAGYFRMSGLHLEDGTARYFFHNIYWRYILGAFATLEEPAQMDIRNEFRGRPMHWEPRRDGKPGVHCELRIPPHGTGVIDIK